MDAVLAIDASYFLLGLLLSRCVLVYATGEEKEMAYGRDIDTKQ